MNDLLAKLKTPKDCAVFEKNARDRGRPDLALIAKKRHVELLAIEHGASTEVEQQCVEAIYAYEQVLSEKNGKRTRASRTWPMIAKYGIIEAVERAVNRKDETMGYTSLLKMGLEDYAFESVVLRHPTEFAADVVRRSQERIDGHHKDSQLLVKGKE